MRRYKVGILGATGAVGQRFVQLLAGHPWFEVAEVAASEESAGRPYREAVNWRLPAPLPLAAAELVVKPARPELDCDLVFSGLDASVAGPIEEEFARAGYAVVSNCRSHRLDDDVPLLIPEVNPEHLALISVQQRQRGYGRGFIVTNPNCSATGLALALKPLQEAFGLDEVFVATLQALSGAGYPGPAAADLLDNVIPHIEGEEQKLETEPRKILGRLQAGRVLPAPVAISAHCHRVPVADGHLESVSVKLRELGSAAEVRRVWEEFSGEPQRLGLPSAPARPLLVREESDRPQPRLDRDAERGMAAVVGRIRPCRLLDVKFTLLSHNTIRGAAGGAILNAELLAVKGYLEAERPAATAAGEVLNDRTAGEIGLTSGSKRIR